MSAIPAWFWLVLAAIPVAIAASLVYYQPDAAGTRFRRRWGLTRSRQTVAVVAWLAMLVAFGLLGGVPGPGDETSIRSFGFLVLGWSVPLLGGLLGFAGARGIGRRWRRLQSGQTTPPSADGPLVRSGPANAPTPTTSPVTRRDALCWSWRAEVYDPYGAEAAGQRGSWVTMEAGTGGVQFSVDDEHAPVDVDPANVRLDLRAERTRSFDPDEGLSDSARKHSTTFASDHEDKERRFHESILAPNVQVTVVASSDADEGESLDGQDVLVAAGTSEIVSERYRTRALVLVFGGLAGVSIGVWGLVRTFGVSFV